MATDTDPVVQPTDQGTGVNYLELTFALMGGVAAWLFRLIINAALVPYSCGINSTWPILLVTAVSAAIAGASLWSALRFWRRKDSGDDASLIGTAGWLGLLGVLFNIMALSGIILETVPVFVIDLCASVFPAI